MQSCCLQRDDTVVSPAIPHGLPCGLPFHPPLVSPVTSPVVSPKGIDVKGMTCGVPGGGGGGAKGHDVWSPRGDNMLSPWGDDSLPHHPPVQRHHRGGHVLCPLAISPVISWDYVIPCDLKWDFNPKNFPFKEQSCCNSSAKKYVLLITKFIII